MDQSQREINRIIYEGGLQRQQPRDEALVHYGNLLTDSIKFCIRDFKQGDTTDSEKTCLKNYLTKNFQLLNSITKL
jgi:hypothetical protein